MKAPNLHLNLLHASERQSSSPVRLRVMLPIFAALACVGCLVWWGVLACQLMLVKAQVKAVQQDLAAKKKEHSGVLDQMAARRNAQAELDQLTMYKNGRRTYGELLKKLPEVVPEGVQLLALEIPEPPAQNLVPPGAKPGSKVQPLLGPTGTVENVSLRILGRTAKDGPVKEMMKSLESPAFADSLLAAQKGADLKSTRSEKSWPDTSPDVRNKGFLAFEVMYRCVERRFEK